MDLLYILLVSVIVIGLVSLIVVVMIDKFLRAREVENDNKSNMYGKDKKY